MADINDFFKNIDKKTLQKGIEKASEFAKTSEGKKMIDNIKKNNPKDKDSIMKMIEQNPEMFKTIEKFFNQ